MREVRDQRLRDEDVPESRVSERPDDGHFAPELLYSLPDVDDQFPGGRDVGELVLKPGIFFEVSSVKKSYCVQCPGQGLFALRTEYQLMNTTNRSAN